MILIPWQKEKDARQESKIIKKNTHKKKQRWWKNYINLPHNLFFVPISRTSILKLSKSHQQNSEHFAVHRPVRKVPPFRYIYRQLPLLWPPQVDKAEQTSNGDDVDVVVVVVVVVVTRLLFRVERGILTMEYDISLYTMLLWFWSLSCIFIPINRFLRRACNESLR